jgi:two-component system NarL family sensor kinase
LKWLADGTYGLRYHASIPLYAQDKKLGVMNLASKDWRELSGEDLKLLYTVGDLLSIAIERARLFEKSVEMGTLEERNRLAREIHDTLAQGLSAIALHLETADALLESHRDADNVRHAILKALQTARENLSEARQSVLDLRATPLKGRSLLEAITALASAARGESGLAITLESAGAARPLSSRVEIGLYRIAQEAIRNILLHAQAQQASLSLITTPEKVHLRIEDDGVGFDPDAIPAGHFGLIGMTERARMMGGKLVLRSHPGTGTVIEAVIPLLSTPDQLEH